MSMDVPNGLCCRYCGRRWFKHDIQVHEKNCRLKILSTIKVLEGRYHKMHIPAPPEWEPWILPPKVSLAEYNNYASRFYSSTMPECPSCLRKFPITALNEHINECTESLGRSMGGTVGGGLGATGGATKKLKASLGPDEGRATQKPKLKPKPQPQPTSGPGIDNKFGGPPVSRQGPDMGARAGGADMKIGGSGKGTYNFDNIEVESGGVDGRIECHRCGRKFAPDRITQHERICNKLKALPDEVDKAADGDTNYARTREPDPSRFKKNGTTGFNKANIVPKTLTSSGDHDSRSPSIKSSSNAAARGKPFGGKGMGGSAPFGGGGGGMNDGRVECRRCGRKFAPDRIDKHESICKNIQNMDPRANNPNLRENMITTSRASTIGSSGAGTRQSGNMGRSMGPQRGSGAPTRAPPARSATGGQSKFCSECGSKFASDTAKFCMECGSKR
ncbi:Hypothetical protein DHA2_8405 [Giardia duodenalis]|uniref:C2HC/C3H-type domain-containing protein n=1 Tax=Giardia intestinalis TaxID=5741 RepID=V6T9W9_GIAIN|nr:Hypothetical protein DHA2_8405 [Giardia intestinalis]